MGATDHLKNVSDFDKKMIQDIEAMMGPEPETMGFIKNLFWGKVREELIFPYPTQSKDEVGVITPLLEKITHYFKTKHPAREIDEKQEIPEWVLKELFSLGIMGLTIPQEYGGLGLGITSYNRVLEVIGSYCGGTSVLVSAHQSIGCKAVMLYGTEDQKKYWLPKLASDTVSAFCLSEPNVGCDAAGQQTQYELDKEGNFILNGEKKWTTSGAFSGLCTVMAKDKITGKITAFICTPDMEGFDVFEKNRSKCGIRGTWQARIRLTNVIVPKENVLHKVGSGLQVALTCLNYGRCTLSAGMLGAAERSRIQAIKWANSRFQFKQPLSYFELVKEKIARMTSLSFAMNSMLYYTTGILDRKDKDIMVETATCKLFCSEMGYRIINDAMQIMGGEGYMTENNVERAFRDSRIYLIVEGANEVMQAFVFAYGGKQLAEQMLSIREAFLFSKNLNLKQNIKKLLKNSLNLKIVCKGISLGVQLFLTKRVKTSIKTKLHSDLKKEINKIMDILPELNYQFKQVSKNYQEKILTMQVMQARIATMAMWLFASFCVISNLNKKLSQNIKSSTYTCDVEAGRHFVNLAVLEIKKEIVSLYKNTDASMLILSKAALDVSDLTDNDEFVIAKNQQQ